MSSRDACRDGGELDRFWSYSDPPQYGSVGLTVTCELFADCQYTLAESWLMEVILLSKFQRRLLNAVPDGIVTVTVKGSNGKADEGSVQTGLAKQVTET